MSQSTSRNIVQSTSNKRPRTEDGRLIRFGCQRPGHIFRQRQFLRNQGSTSPTNSEKAPLEIEPSPPKEKTPN